MKRVKSFPCALLLGLLLGLLPNTALAVDGRRPFTDVPDNAWYSEAVRYVYEKGMMDGTDGGAFSPDAAMSRGMLATVLHRLEGRPAVSGGTQFPDVPAGQWYTDAAAWAGETGIVEGYDDGNFGPNDPATREQMVTILYRYAKYKEYFTESLGNAAAFPDGDTVSAYAADAVDWAIGNGLLQGDGGLLFPGGGADRAQAAAVLMRFCENAARSYAMTVVSAIDVMCEPSGILFLEDGSFLVADTYNNVIWQVADGVSTVYAGGETVSDRFDRPVGGHNDADLLDAHFNNPWAIIPFLDGYVVSDSDNDALRLIRTEFTQTVNGTTEEDLTVTDMGVVFSHPTGLAADGDGNLYVSDTFAGAVRVITPEGTVSTLIDGLNDPMGLCWRDGTLYITETGADRIVKVTDGQLTVMAGSGEDDLVDGPVDQAAFSSPQGITMGEDGTIYVSDTVNGAVRQIKNGIVTTIAIRDESDLSTFIPTSPVGLAVYGDQLYVCDSFARKVFMISLT